MNSRQDRRHPVRWLLLGVFLIAAVRAPIPTYGQSTGEIAWPADRPALSTESPPGIDRPARSNYHVVALLVEFQPDDSRFTTGDGTFDGELFEGLVPIVDPLPHDRSYFEARLRFLSNYVRRASGGATTVTSHIVPGIVRVSQPMGAYSPTGPQSGSDEEMARLAGLVDEAWNTADPGTALDGFESDELVFVIFHAGVGRDLELMGTTLDKTPEDLPSLFFGTSALTRLLGTLPSVQGRTIDHTLILPRTETRRGYDSLADEAFLAEFSINGMLAATFFSRLGVPDLFNTETGASAIGPFGLMDPLGIFAFNGLFPPEPSAWTKQYLGWANVTTAPVEDPAGFSLSAASTTGRTSIVRVPISDAEYFLLENRFRGAEDVSLTVWRDGAYHEFTAGNETDGFSRFDISSFPGGVVVDVSNYDWALPGGLDEDGNLLSGGMLIWHIDERVIRAGLSMNRINVDPRRRGVGLREADGSQDIGYPALSDFGPQVHLGTPFDFFFENNPVRVVTRTGREIALYENRFGPDTVPSSRTNDGGNSFVQIRDFSASAETMTFIVERSDSPLLRREPELNAGPAAAGSSVLTTRSAGGLLYFSRSNRDEAGELVSLDPGTGQRTPLFDRVASRPAVTSNGALVVVRETSGEIEVIVGIETFALDAPPSALAPIVKESSVFVVDGRGRLWHLGSGQTAFSCLVCEDAGDVAIASTAETVRFAADQRLYAITAQGEVLEERALPTGFRSASMVVGGAGNVKLFDAGTRRLLILDGSDIPGDIDTSPFIGSEGSAFLVPFVQQDQERPAVFLASGSSLAAFGNSGAMLAGFPIRLEAEVTAQPITVREDESELLLVPLSNGQLDGFRITPRGQERAAGFPLSIGQSIRATPAVIDGILHVVSETGRMARYRFLTEVTASYAEENGDAQNARRLLRQLTEMPGVPPDFSIIEAETYNWPNPIRSGHTYIRVATSHRADIDVHVIDAAGRTLERLALNTATPAVPAEIRWDTDAVSGLYFARVRATAENGAEDVRVIKMAIMR